MPMLDSITVEIIQIISQIAKKDPSEIQLNSDMLDLDLDSLSWLDVLAAVEKKYSIQISDDELTKMNKVEDLVHYISIKLLQ